MNFLLCSSQLCVNVLVGVKPDDTVGIGISVLVGVLNGEMCLAEPAKPLEGGGMAYGGSPPF